MVNTSTWSVEEIEALDFSSVVALTNEPNMCSGGKETIRTIIRESLIRHDASILEVGSNTGFSCIEFATLLPHAQITGVDINATAVLLATKKAQENNVHNVKFIQSDARCLSFPDNSFDMVFCSNVTSFIDDKEAALSEYLRVLKPGGILAAVPIYYVEIPPFELKQKVESAIKCTLEVWDQSYWRKFFDREELELFFIKEYKFIPSTREEIIQYTNLVFSNPIVQEYSFEIREALKRRLQYFYELFDNNLQYTNFSIMLFRYNPANNYPVLHKSKEL